MFTQYLTLIAAEQSLSYETADIAQGVGIQLASFLFPLLVVLDDLLDKRLGFSCACDAALSSEQ